MASSLLSSSSTLSLSRFKELKYSQVRAQSFRDDGTSANMVDANMGILKERMADLRMKERLEKCCNRNENGWNYKCYGYDDKHKRYDMLCESLEVMSSASGALAFVFLGGSLCIFLVSLLVHLSTS